MVQLINMVTLDLMFTCEKCGHYILHKAPLRADLRIDLTNMPPGWKGSLKDGYLKVYCPYHAMEAP